MTDVSRRAMTQLCRACGKLVQAEIVVENDGGYRVSDRSTCTECGAVLWDWKVDPGAPAYVPKEAAKAAAPATNPKKPQQGSFW